MRVLAQDFKAFLLRGNVVDLAVAVVIGAAFGAVVSSLVENLLTPLAAIPGQANFDELAFNVRRSTFHYGAFLNDLISFLAIAASIFFFVVRPVNRLMSLKKTERDVESTTRPCPECLSEIPREARRCSFCTSQVGVSS